MLVIDASVVGALVDPVRVDAVSGPLERWHAAAEDLHAPDLFTYELASALARMLATGAVEQTDCDDLWHFVDLLRLTLHRPADGAFLVAIARQLNRRSAYDAAYIDLTLRLGCELWTLDGKLARNARSHGLPVVLMV